MSGLRSFAKKQHREVRRRNHIAKDLRSPKYGPRIRESKRQHLIDELHERDCDEELYWLEKEIGLGERY